MSDPVSEPSISTDTPPPLADRPMSPTEFHQQLALDLFNYVWSLLEKPERNCDEVDRMIHAAHASRFHWELGGTPTNLALGEWQCSRVHAVMAQPDAALFHARRYLRYAEDYDLGPFHLAYAHEALARTFALTDRVQMRHHLEEARKYGAEIEDEEERALLKKDLAAIEASVKGPA